MRVMPKVVTPIPTTESREPRPAPPSRFPLATVVQLSPAVAGAQATSTDHDDVRVGQIKAALASGTYAIDRDALAQTITGDQNGTNS